MRLDKTYKAVDELLGAIQSGENPDALEHLIAPARAAIEEMRDGYHLRLKLNGRLRGSGRTTHAMIEVLSKVQELGFHHVQGERRIVNAVFVVVSNLEQAEFMSRVFRGMAEKSALDVNTLKFGPGFAELLVRDGELDYDCTIRFVPLDMIDKHMKGADPHCCIVDHAVWMEG